MPYLVPLSPPLLDDRELRIDQDSFSISNPKGPKVGLPDDVPEQRGPLKNLLSSDLDPVNRLSNSAVIVAAVVPPVQAQELADVIKTKRRLGATEITQNLVHLTANKRMM
jgi:hypothetical protein